MVDVAHSHMRLLQVPVMRAHAESINLEFEEALDEDEALKLLGDFPGVSIMDDRANNRSVAGFPGSSWVNGSVSWRRTQSIHECYKAASHSFSRFDCLACQGDSVYSSSRS